MKLLQDIERRLNNWARWRRGGSSGGLGYSALNWSTIGSMIGASADRYREARVPTNDAEASVTDQAVLALPSELRATVEAHYLGDGSQRKTALRLACSQSTVRVRLVRAHLAINAWLHDRKASLDIERARIEALVHSSRP